MPSVNLLIIISGLAAGGAELMLLRVLERLNSRISPSVISLTSTGDIGFRIQQLGIPVQAIGMELGLRMPLDFYRLVQRIRKLEPDVVHTWMYHADLLGGIASRLARVPSVAWGIRHSNHDRHESKFLTRLVVGACSRVSSWVPDTILSCSEVARDVHVDLGYPAAKMRVVPNGFDLSRFRPDPSARAAIRSELGLGGDTPLVGLIARFDPQKNHSGFFAMAGLLRRKIPAIQFVLAGKDIDEANPKLLEAARSAGVENATHLLGNRTDASSLMAALDVLASTSSYGEAFPNVVAEAMASGVPCAVTDVGDSASIVGDTGVIVEAGDMAGLAAAIEAILSLSQDERQFLGERARARIAEHFEIGAIVKRYEGFYEELAAESSKRLRR